MIAIVSRAAFWAAILLALVMALLPPTSSTSLWVGQYGDKPQHMLAFGALSLLAAVAYPDFGLLRLLERLSFLGAMIELLQSMPVFHRDCDIHDWIADTAIMIVVLSAVALARRLRAGPIAPASAISSTDAAPASSAASAASASEHRKRAA